MVVVSIQSTILQSPYPVQSTEKEYTGHVPHYQKKNKGTVLQPAQQFTTTTEYYVVQALFIMISARTTFNLIYPFAFLLGILLLDV